MTETAKKFSVLKHIFSFWVHAYIRTYYVRNIHTYILIFVSYAHGMALAHYETYNTIKPLILISI